MGLFGLFSRRSAQPNAPAAEAPRRRRYLPQLGRMARAMETAFGSAAASDRLTSSWSNTPEPADQIIRKHQRVLVARSRQQCTENPYAKGFLRMCRQNIIGPAGVMLQALVRKATGELVGPTNDAIEAAFKEWGKAANCSVTGRKGWVALQLSAVQWAARDGEFMFRMVYGKVDAGPWGFALQELDPQRCPVDFDLDLKDGTGRFIRHGIEFNRYGRPLVYHFTADDETEADYVYGGRPYVKIPAEDIIHGFKDELGSQKRGLPWIATGMAALRHLGGMEDAAVINARVGAAKVGVIQWKDGEGPELDEDDEVEIDGEPGTFPVLPSGAELTKWDPQYPAGEFAPFAKHMVRRAAVGWGVTYNNLASDLEGVNFSSIRQGTLDERERWKEDQEWIIEQLCQRVFDAWLPIAVLQRRIKVNGQALRAERMDDYRACAWQPRRWTWIDPNADVKAAVESKNNLLKSPGEVVREGGRDPAQVYREIAQDIKDMKAAGIPDDFILMAFGQKIAPEPKTPKDEKVTA